MESKPISEVPETEISVFKGSEPDPDKKITTIDENNSFSFDNVFKSNKKDDNVVIEVKKLDSTKEIDTNKNDLDETSSLANFFDDLQQISDDKDINVNDSPGNFLFADANETDIK